MCVRLLNQQAHALQPEDTGVFDEVDTIPPKQLEGAAESDGEEIPTPTPDVGSMPQEDGKLDRGSCAEWLSTSRSIKGPARDEDGNGQLLGGSKGDSSSTSKKDEAPPEAGARAGDRVVVDLTGEASDDSDEPPVIYLDDD
jgi:hypothetical protein